MTEVNRKLSHKFSKVKTRTYLVCSAYLITLISGATWLSYNFVLEKKEEIQVIEEKRDALKIRLDQMIYDYNKTDGYQKIRLNDKGYIEYYDIKVKPNTPVVEHFPNVQVDGELKEGTALPLSDYVAPITLENHFETEIPPDLYAEINSVVEHTKNDDFKKVVARMMQDGKITNAEYSEIKIPLAMLLSEVELSKAKENLNKSLK